MAAQRMAYSVSHQPEPVPRLRGEPPRCDLCQRENVRLYPVTQYDPSVHRWVARRCCLTCCGPAYPEDGPRRAA